MEINQSITNTSRNYGINNFDIKNEDFCKNIGNFSNFKIINAENYKTINNYIFETRFYLSQEFKSQSLENSNVNLKFNFEKTQNTPAIIEFNFDKESTTLVDNLEINVADNIRINLIIKYISSSKCYHNGRVKFNIGKNSNTNVIYITDLSKNSNNYNTIESNLLKNANFSINFINIAENNTIYNYFSNINGENATSNTNTIYIGKDNSKIDLNYYTEISSPKDEPNFFVNSKCDIDVVGALFDSSQKNFKGTINFLKGAKKSVGAENEFCMLLSKKAKSKSLPMLLCTEEDVSGNHSSATKRVDDKELFYIMSRGLSKNEATKLLIKARFNRNIKKIFDEEIREWLINKIDKEL